MTPSPTQPSPEASVEQLVAAMLDETLTEDQEKELMARVRGDREATEMFLDLMEAHAILQWEVQWKSAAAAIGDLAACPVGAGLDGAVEQSSKPLSIFSLHRRSMRYALAASLVLCVGVIASVLNMISVREHDFQGFSPRPLATLTETADAVFDTSDVPTATGSQLPGGFLRLKYGTAKVVFFSGAEVTLHGPCEFGLNSPMRGYLKQGRITAYVPQQAHGFTVGGPACAVIDLGTRFTMTVGEVGGTHVLVQEGRVQFQRTDAQEHPIGDVSMLAVGQIATLDAGSQTISVETASKAAIADIDSSLVLATPIHHWTFDEQGGDVAHDSAGKADLKLSGSRIGVPGVVGGALALDSKPVTSVNEMISSGDSFTIACWVKPGLVDASKPECQIFAAGFGGERFIGLSIVSRHELGLQSVVGLYEGGDHTAAFVSTPDDACVPGKWMHVVVTSPDLESGEVMKVYINGVLQPHRALGTEFGFNGTGKPVCKGWPSECQAHIGHKDGQRTSDMMLDDMRLYRGELTADQIGKLYQQASDNH